MLTVRDSIEGKEKGQIIIPKMREKDGARKARESCKGGEREEENEARYKERSVISRHVGHAAFRHKWVELNEEA
ncbi:hypothetical protein X798_04170 [Onchocerca flexuosa]|uniref:Uncharacterized protein n=2 Tax=Onchocerca flexuosa TaxID=387005 RepID=A0A183HFY1_9BILA|nr:hypothetical protein X798_04170 [Onchocerca flexuosa]VDO46420.1 unnamed protein product [Onchocerca flexuosa]